MKSTNQTVLLMIGRTQPCSSSVWAFLDCVRHFPDAL